MKKVYYLKTCSTCIRILKEISTKEFKLQDIKSEPVSVKQLEEMHTYTNSYEALFNKRSKKYAAMDLKNQVVTEQDYRQLILNEYTFLKRPVIIIDKKYFCREFQKNS